MMMSKTVLEKEAACKDKDTNIFFVDEVPVSSPAIRMGIAKAISICNICNVQALCLMTAVNNEEEYGIWGGLTSKERKKMFKNKKITLEEAEEVVLWKRSL
jgi:hypothetical protein